MAAKALVVGGYFLVLLLVGFFTQRRARAKDADYFLASRSLSPLLLFITMAATNFSAFTVFGFSGAGWRIGYAFYPIMAFGTGFMALSFFIIGRPVWRLGREKGLLTPPELILDRLGSPTLRLLFLAVLVAFTLPYLAMQPMAAGYALEGLLGIPYLWGAVLVTAVMLAYLLLGGMRAVAWTAVVQGVMMIVFLALALGVIAGAHGGLTSANRAAAEAFPALFSRPGGGGV
ncbi:MAG: sodium:solute symporter family protein, partial [Candidatus Bipolaricaulota bacterium]|nr:sodium:solute symporter family protein [Candidatus Bipolaricaulota bacterium]